MNIYKENIIQSLKELDKLAMNVKKIIQRIDSSTYKEYKMKIKARRSFDIIYHIFLWMWYDFFHLNGSIAHFN